MQTEITCIPLYRKRTKMYVERFPANFMISSSAKVLQFSLDNPDRYNVCLKLTKMLEALYILSGK